MIEWRDSDKWVADGREDEYADLSSNEIEDVSTRLDGMFKNYIKGAVEGEHDYVGYADGSASQRAAFKYSDVSTNAYQEPVITDTVFELEHVTYPQGLMIEIYNINIARQIIIDHKRKESIIDGEVCLETSRFVRAPFIEHYTFITYRGNERQAFIDQLDLTTEHGEMQERTLTRYDQTTLNAEIITIEQLYDIAQRERAIIE